MKLKKDQQRFFDWISEHGTPRGMTLGRGRPHDERIVKSLIDACMIKAFTNRPPMQNEYAVRGPEDKHGLALFVCPKTETVFGATWYGSEVKPFGEDDWQKEHSDSAYQNGIDTAWELYPDDEARREWMELAAARSTLAMYE